MTALQKPVVYNAKVTAEIAKQVYTKEGMAFPTGAQFSQAQQTLQETLKIKNLKSLKFSDVAKGGVIFAEIYTFFLIGEIVGRRNLIGYNVKSEESHEH
jgi:F-type H+-transporting ATPase subunit g